MDSKIRVLHGKIQRQEISIEQAALEFEKLRADARHDVAPRLIEAPSASAGLIAAAVYRHDEPCLRDHQFNRQQILLGLTYASLALEHGLGQLADGEALQLKKLTFAAPMALAAGEQLEVAIRAAQPGFEAVCRRTPLAPWQVVASGELSAVAVERQQVAPAELMAGMTAVELASIYQISEQIHIGESYRTLQALYQQADRSQALSRVSLSDARQYGLHPLLINSAFLTIVPLLAGEQLASHYIPLGIKSLTFHQRQAPATGWIHARLMKNSGELVLFDAELYGDDGALIAQFNGCSLKRLRDVSLVDQAEPHAVEITGSSAALEDYLLSQLHAIGASQVGKKQRQRNLMDLGLESMQLVNLAQRIASAALIELEPTVFFEYPSIAELATFLWQEHRMAFSPLLGEQGKTSEVAPVTEPGLTSGPMTELRAEQPQTDIAIIGMHGQFGEAADLDQFWRNIWQDLELIKQVPADHWDITPWFDADPDAKDKTYSRWGSFIDDVDKFDAGFFNMSRREAQWMDPQVRLLLQSAYSSAENAGVIQRLRGSNTGVFIGSCFNEYVDKISELGLPMDPYIATGSGTIAANRISFWFDFKGPSLMFNTACSSSLVALHAACVALRNGECGMAFVGGSNLLLSSWHYRYFSAIRALSPTGHCHTFDARADGYVPGECVATLLLKPLAQALADGDPIHGVIKGSAALHGGYTPSLTAPSVAGEENVILHAWQNAGIDPRTLSYIEAHGTGTRLGDPIEINALKRAFARYTDDRGFCHIGSVKANIGHTEGAAGIAGVLKVLQQMKHRKLPALGHFKEQNAHIKLDDSPLLIDTEGRDWPEQDTPRRAGISSFGFSGTNAHAVLEEYREQRAFATHQGQQVLVPVSARNEQRLQEQVLRLLDHLKQHTPDLAALAYTLQTGREAMAVRAIFTVDSLEQLQHQLQAWIAGERGGVVAAPVMSAEQALAAADLRQLAALWLAGADDEDTIDWAQLYSANRHPARISLPCYAFAKERHWLEAPTIPAVAEGTLLTYTEQWLSVEEPVGGTGIKRVICLLTEPRLRQQLAREIHALSPHTELVFIAAADANGRDEEGHYRVAAHDPQQLQQGLQQALSAHGATRILYLWGMDDRRWISDSSPIVALLKAMAATATPIDRLLLAGRAGDVLERCHLESWIGIERSLGAVMDCPVEVAIDLPHRDSDDSRWLRRVWLQLSGKAAGSRLYQDMLSLRPVLTPTLAEPTVEPLTLEQLNTLLITGGLGELGLLLASELSNQARHRSSGQLHLLLNGRSPLSTATQARIDALSHERCKIFHVQADCADRIAMTAALAEILPQSGPIDGLIHAAGLKASGSVFVSSAADFNAVLNAKIKATQVLGEVLSAQPLALICHFSSSSALLGDMGACSYAMANRFQQAYARYVQTGRTRRVVAINWPLWRDGGMAVGERESTEFYLKSSGQRMLESTEGLALLRRIVSSDVEQVLVLAGQPARLQQMVAGINEPTPKATAETPSVSPVRNPAHSRPELKGLSLERSLLWDLRELASRPLNAERQTLGEDTNLADFGFDSISLAEYAGLLSRHLGLKLTPEVFFSHSTLAKLAGHLLAQYRQAVEAYYLRTVASAPEPVPVATSTITSSPDTDAIAIIGISGRFPGARTPDELWQLLAEGRDLVGEIPAERYDWREHYGDPRENPAKTRCIWMGSVPGIDEFDPLFFGISPREAKNLDPRQRLLLQESWNALEDAGIGPRQLAAQRVGMFVGVEEGDFQRLAGEESLTSSHNGILASRLAYFLNLTGPTMAINTACSSALVALHQAASSLRNHECEMVIAAGVNLIFSPDAFIGMTQAGMLSPDGKCFTFDHRANGMVPGEAVCCVLLKPLSRAEADGDHIYGVLRASGINYDGKTNGITAPSGVSQQRLLEDVYRRAGIDTQAVDYIVTHGTGTQLGDPVEINALNDAFRGNTAGHCALTSTKTNLGHTFAASGLVSVISLLQALRHETIPASLHCEQENDYIQWQQSPFYVNKANKAWPQAGRDRERIGAVSAFGMSGTNAHVVLQSYSPQHAGAALRRPCYLLVLSAKTAEALQEKAAQLNVALEQGGYLDQQLPSISHTLLEGRHHFRYRLALVAADLEEARYGLQRYLAGEKRPNLFGGEVEREFAPRKTVARYIEQLLDDSLSADENELRELLSGLADCYRQGYDIDARRLFVATPPRVSLPGYPFARERYWPEVRQRSQPDAGSGVARLHPLLHRNISTLARQCFVSRFSGRETFLADHRIGEQLIFPGAAYLEMAREAIVRASELPAQHITLRNMVWLRPLAFAVAGDTREVELFCELTPSAGDSLSFRIYSFDGTAQQLHAQGDALLATVAAATPPALELAQLAAACNLGERSHEALYRDFDAIGVHYGKSFRAAGQIHMGRDRVLGQLSGAALDPKMDGVLLPPGILDSALHIAASLGSGQQAATEPALPFALESLRLYGSVEQSLRLGPLTVIATRRAMPDGAAIEKIDLQICNHAGECLLQLEGFSSRRTGAEQTPAQVTPQPGEALGRLIRTPFWQPLDSPGEALPADVRPHLLLLGLPDAVVTELRRQFGGQVSVLPGAPGETSAAIYQTAALALLKSLQQRDAKAGDYLQLYVGQGQDDLRLSALDALLSTAMIENCELKVRLVAVDPDMGDTAMSLVIAEQSRFHCQQRVRIFANGSLYGSQWRELAAESAPHPEPGPFRDAGVYAITGGAGGLGLIFAEQIASSCRNPVLYLAGRSVLSAPAQQKFEQLEALGARVLYQPLDVSDTAAVRQWIDGIYAEQGELHGVIHSAGVIRDSLIIHKSASDFEQVLAAKVAGIEALDRAIGERPLDFLLCCSSQAALGNLGQADYACANAWMDAFMHYRQNLAADGKRKGRSLSINWPLWRDGGMRLAAVIEQQMREQFGIVPMPLEEGLGSLRQLLTHSVSAQAWVVYGESSRLASIGQITPAQPAAKSASQQASATTSLSDSELRKHIETFVTRIIAKVTQIDAAKIHPAEKFEVYGFDSIMAVGVTNELEKHLGSLPKTLLFEHVNIAGMVDHFAVKYRERFAAMFGGDEPQPEPAAVVPAPSSESVFNRFAPATPASVEQVEDSDLAQYVAVIGLGGYYPGADNMDQLWQNLANGVDSMSEFPAERWDHRKLYYKNRDVLGKTTCINGSFIKDVDKFDYSYFKMPKVYADHMSPEVRLFLQAAVHTFEDAGYSRETLQSRYGGNVGVLLGAMTNDYHYYGFEHNLSGGAIASGSGMATIPMTVSYFYGLTGPSLFIDTMCSSSSTCIHTAFQMLRHDETMMVLAGGLNLMYHPYTAVNTSQGNFTSITSESVNSYGVGADGTVIGEGVGAVLLKRLDRAIADRDQIYGVIKGSAITNAGERNGFNVPNPDLQTLAIRQAMEQAKVHPSSISYVEGHGSGTRLGDPIEVLGLNNAFSRDTDDKQFCYLGSIKSNIGHLLAASGVAGLTKTLLQLKHGQIAPSIHSGLLNQDIDFADTPFMVPQQLTQWRRPERVINGEKQQFPRRAGLTSIAAGGMNAHMIVEEYPQPADSAGQIADERLAFVFSVHKLSVLVENLTCFRDWLASSEASLAQIAYTLQVGKNNLRNRLVVRCDSRQALLDTLTACIDGRYGSTTFYRFQETDAAQLPDTDGPLAPLLSQWLSGDNNVDWAGLYGQQPQRISLPVYAFEKNRCWYTEPGYESAIINPLSFTRKLHPLVAENCSTTQPGALFRTDFVPAQLLDYVYRAPEGQRISTFNFADVALAMPALVSRFDGCTLSVSCAFEHFIADWATVSGLAYRLLEIDEGQLELEFDVWRQGEQSVNLGFALINPLTGNEPALAQSLLDAASELLNGRSGHRGAADVSQRLAQAGYDFSPYLDNQGELVISRSGLLLEGRPPVNRHNHHADTLQLSPYLATTLDKAFYLLLEELGLPQGRVIVRNIEQLCCYEQPAGQFSVILTRIGLNADALAFSVLVLDEQARICLKADRVSLHLGAQELANIRHDHHWLAGTVAAVVRPLSEPTTQPVSARLPAQDGDGESALGERILAFIQQELQHKLGFAPQEIGESAQVHDLGLDSIMVVQLTDSVNKRFGTKLMPDLFYEKQQLGELAAKLQAV
ncbi:MULTISPECIES: SDR family NAD(P)-dependent oxidoreductase [Gammaproteobacteria]|uniref:SDR family NAD(P)-dependent oxidoreductase n=1 Tax=Gammaproteobacteria TaxID=1236 RepID=UPI001911DC68|nr:SDR family NAD(P)-dependent oxidoreductase [Bacillus sp. TH86]MBK5312920.1 SDR family NAD(P)-dependent oxidoreductase [Pseudomonas sp. TH71]MBK5318417.1 SDR family NAD(P)-dependent oxidoreductase [Erwinia sp. TH79]MBK5323919.1 SDR family NAD(P)-dependent oxidoreductase [Bacillus sp. TH59]MBK5338869.1 SDR family NAD(P)-dependent oxidoreductase [Bacillus sp. TH57]MBK5372124.1 SDR family NAD(P)-dependent oxidoreductase [Pseudomonas sp. TH40]MBK5383293.1 SDR family NAD(P)-dependent oxidoreduct